MLDGQIRSMARQFQLVSWVINTVFFFIERMDAYERIILQWLIIVSVLYYSISCCWVYVISRRGIAKERSSFGSIFLLFFTHV